MSQNNRIRALVLLVSVVFLSLFFSSCSNKKNTAANRFYHSINTRYNIHYNAGIAYKEALEAKEKGREENLSQILYIFPQHSDSLSTNSQAGSFTTTIDKTTKAIKLHSIKTKPKKDPDRRNDAGYQAWLQQKEYTPFMDVVWLLLAKAEFQEEDYLQAITTFLYITKIYSSQPGIVAECRLWIARAYTEMGWMYEAGNILHKMELAGEVPDKHTGLYSLVKANYLVYNNEYEAAIPHIEVAVKKTKDKHLKLRMKYLLGQLYAGLGDKLKAEKAFASVRGMSTPYKYSINAQLQQIQLDDTPGKTKALSQLAKMSKSSKNEEYLDQVYYIAGNIYLEKSDTIHAIENYKKAIGESTRNGYDKAVSQIKLGDVYFEQRKFVLAQPCYSEALAQLTRNHTDYPRVALRSGVLDELAVHVKTVEEQDSLQYLAQLPEEERLAIINGKIAGLRDEEEKKAKEEETQKRIEERVNNISSWGDIESSLSKPPTATIPTVPIRSGSGDSFYFYNDQAVAQGKIAFRQQWGTRKPEDDWRRRNKVSSGMEDILAAETESETNKPDSLLAGQPENKAPVSEDIYSVDYYLQQLPLTPEAIRESDELIENALFNMGKIYKDKLANMELAIDAFNTDIRRFPSTPNLEEIYYQLLLIYMRTGNESMMAQYRSKLLSGFPDGKYATPLSQPDYVWNFRHMASLQDSLYNEAYEAYRKADIETVRRNYQAMKTKYPFTDLMPNFALLNALTYAQTRDAGGLMTNLASLTENYPKADVTPLASEILNRVKEGKLILSDGSPITDFNWDKAYASSDTTDTGARKALQYSDTLDVPHILLFMFKPKTIDRNDLLYQVADYNFSNYVIQTFDLSFDTDPPYDVLQVKGFESFAAIRSYLTKAFNEDMLIQNIDPSVFIVPVSVENYTTVMPRLGLEQYIKFFSKHYNNLLPQLVSYWKEGKYNIETLQESPEKEKVEPELPAPTNIKPVRPINRQPEDEKTKQPVNEKEVTADDILSKDQLEKAGKVIGGIENIINNPVDGIKNLFGKNKENLTKEEKAALKEEEKLRKQRDKELKAIEKNRTDSIKKAEKAKNDSLAKAEEAVQDSIKTAQKVKEQQRKLEEQQKKDEAKATLKAKENVRKQKEAERREKERLQKKRLRQIEKERKDKEKASKKERKEKEKQAEEKRKQREKGRNSSQ
ncbi:MAG: tetratricopeptide repeat protein [Prevotella sp.]|nr:tetratricopeptide repeat protein [Prevotella sp.]